MKIIWLACPACGKKLGSGRGFGPEKMTCPKCKTAFLTSFIGWDALDLLHKAFSVIGEFLAPSIFRRDRFSSFLLNSFLGAIVTAMTFSLVIGTGDLRNMGAVKTVFLIATMWLYPVLLLLRLIAMIRESKAYDRTGDPPVWQWWR